MLPKEIWTIIFLQSRIIDLLPLQLVCKTFNEIICSKFFRDHYINKNMSNDELINYFKNKEIDSCDETKPGDVIVLNPRTEDYFTVTTIKNNGFRDKIIYPLDKNHTWPLKVIEFESVTYRIDPEYILYYWMVQRLYSNLDEFLVEHADNRPCVIHGIITIDPSKIEI